MKHNTRFNLLMILGLVLALSGGISMAHRALAQEPGPQGNDMIQGTPLSSAFTYQGRLADTAGAPIPGPCDLRFTLYESATGADQVGAPQTKSGVTLDNGYFDVALDFGATAFTGGGRFLKIEVDCGSGYTALSPRVELTPAPYTFHAVSTGALHGRPVSDNAPANGEVLAWDGSSWMPTTSGSSNAWSLTGNSGATPGTNFVGTSDNQALQLHVNGARALRLEPHATSPNLIGGYGGNSVSAGVYGATIGGGGMSGLPNRVTANFGTIGGGAYNTAGDEGSTVGGGAYNTTSGAMATVGGGAYNTADDYATVGGGTYNIADYYATVGGGSSNTADDYATVGGGMFNTADGRYATVPGGEQAHASLYGQMAYASGLFASAGDAQASLYVMRGQTTSNGSWEDLYLDGNSILLTIAPTRTLTFDILVVGRSDAGESAGYYIWGVAENVGGTTTVWATTMILHEDDGNWDALATGIFGDHLAVQVMGHGETIRWVATVRTSEVAW
ncbi:MAG: hypothetical protein U9R05_08555 [Chloroflexota bacterium]|nr:hypothetical protein [Chloroflexota bacterium]